jgi:two-component sensor histidine kinase
MFIRSRLLAGPPKLSLSLAIAVICVAAPTLLRWLADPVITGTAFVTYYPFVLLAAIFIGWGGAMGVALASAMLANFLFMAPRYILFAHVGDTLGTTCFLVSSGMIVAVVDTLRRTVIDMEAGRQREVVLNGELKHLNAELQHRVKNTLMVVQGLATQTFRGAPGSDEVVRTFRGRLHALGEAHDILTSGKWETCRFPDLSARALAPFNGDGAITLTGPTCQLPEHACVPLVLALHELGTNSVKYGALSSLEGNVEVRWNVRRATADAPVSDLVLDWIESGGPPVLPPTRKGLGSRLIAPQKGIDAADLYFRSEGLACQLVVSGAVLVSEDTG